MSLLRNFFKLKYNWLPYIILVPGVHILLLPTAMAPHSTPATKQGTHLQWKSGLSFPGWGGDFWWYRTPLPQSHLSQLQMMWLHTGPLHRRCRHSWHVLALGISPLNLGLGIPAGGLAPLVDLSILMAHHLNVKVRAQCCGKDEWASVLGSVLWWGSQQELYGTLR